MTPRTPILRALLAVTVLLNATPTVPLKELVEVKTGVAGRTGLVSAVI